MEKLKELIREARKLDEKFMKATDNEYRVCIERYTTLQKGKNRRVDTDIFFSPNSFDLRNMKPTLYTKVNYYWNLAKNKIVKKKVNWVIEWLQKKK
jgi:hypothetical protein